LRKTRMQAIARKLLIVLVVGIFLFSILSTSTSESPIPYARQAISLHSLVCRYCAALAADRIRLTIDERKTFT
jgi:hypothetical protein